MRLGNGRYLGIGIRYGAARSPAARGNFRVGAGRRPVERQHVAAQAPVQHLFGGSGQYALPLSLGQQRKAVENLGFRDGGGKYIAQRLGPCPSHNLRRGGGTNEFGKDVGVHEDHQWKSLKSGGSRTGSRCGTDISTPPKGSKRERA